MNDIRIAVVLPSRGLIFSQTAEEILQNLEGYDYDIFFSHECPIPDCFEKPLTEALRASLPYSHVWIVEDDMIIPDETLSAMLIMDAPVVTMDYPVGKNGQGAVFYDKSGRVVFSGTGCLLVKREVFDKINSPYFTTDIKWNMANHGSFMRFTANPNTDKNAYGLHDVTFGIKLWRAEIPISVAGNIGQRKLVRLGEPGTNEGAHQIEEWTKINPNHLMKVYKRFPVQPVGKLIEVQTLDGTITVHPDHAKKLIKAGVATKIPKQSVSIDYNEMDF